MTKRATITAAAMQRAIDAAKAGVRVVVRPDGTVIVEPAQPVRDDADELDAVSLKR